MSVKRYTNGADDDQGTILPFMEESPEGDYVLWEDYDATCETLAHTETERDASDAEVERLKAEVERLTRCYGGANMEAEGHCRRAMELRKAGDEMKDAVETYFELMPMLVNEVRAKAMLKGRKAIKAWNAAKEGNPSV